MADITNIVEQLSGLTILEVADLVKQLEEKWGVSAAAPVAAAAGPAVAAAPVEEKTEFDVILTAAAALHALTPSTVHSSASPVRPALTSPARHSTSMGGSTVGAVCTLPRLPQQGK